jgi:acetyltransferase
MAECRWDERGHSDIRPIAASDGEALREFARSLSFESRYLPFNSAVNELDSHTVERLTKIDHRRDAVLIARVRDSKTDRVVGVARYALEADGRSCDFAIAVRRLAASLRTSACSLRWRLA